MSAIQEWILHGHQHYQGECQSEFRDLAKLFSRLQSNRLNSGGAGLAVYFKGKKVVDIYTGKKSATENWQADTLAVCYSTGKGVLATLAHILVSEGFLDYDTPIGRYWPEFAQQGKDKLTLRHILSHQSGLYDIRNLINDAAEMLEWQHMLTVFEQAKPRFSAGEGVAYQALTFGWLVGGLLEKVTGQTLSQLMQQYLVEPLGLDGAYFGLPLTELERVARPFAASKPVRKEHNNQISKKTKRKTSLSEKLIYWSGQNPQDFQDAMVPKGMKNFSFFNEAGLQALVPAANGVFKAHSLAKIYAMLANHGQWKGKVLIKPEVFQELSSIQSFARDRVMPVPMNWRLGYHRIFTLGKAAQQGFGHMGYNSSAAWCDPERNLSFAYTHNFQMGSMTGDYRLWVLTQEALRCADGVLTGRKGWFS